MSALRAVGKLAFSISDLLRAPVRGPRLLIYHQVGAGHGFELDVKEAVFEQHLAWLSENGTVVSLEEAITRRTERDAEKLFVLTFDDGFSDMAERAFPILRAHGFPFTLYLTARSVEDQIPLSARPNSDPIRWEQVNSMLESGLMTLGGHTYAHQDLRAVSQSEIESDIERCDRIILERTGVRPRHFAYPFGYWASSADRAVRARYESAVLGGSTKAESANDPFLLSRLPIQLSDGVAFFRRKARRGLRTEELVRRRLTGYDGP